MISMAAGSGEVNSARRHLADYQDKPIGGGGDHVRPETLRVAIRTVERNPRMGRRATSLGRTPVTQKRGRVEPRRRRQQREMTAQPSRKLIDQARPRHHPMAWQRSDQFVSTPAVPMNIPANGRHSGQASQYDPAHRRGADITPAHIATRLIASRLLRGLAPAGATRALLQLAPQCARLA
jgi:hypothetical protein